MAEYTIKRRERIQSSPPVGMRQEWVEFQVWQNCKIVARCGSQEEAERAVERLRNG